ncbi:MAG: gamma-glutamylcyclotransferase [Pseudomonadota bacterium]
MPHYPKDPEYVLATYGTLAPGRPNHHVLENLKGTWTTGWVVGTLKNAGWGAEQGYPGITIDPKGSLVEVHLFNSADLPEHWARLDAFEGKGYKRKTVRAQTTNGVLEASIYALAD